MSAVESLARVLQEYRVGRFGGEPQRGYVRLADHILADPGPLLEALAEAGVLHRQSAPLKRRAAGGWAMVYGGDHTVEGTRYVTEWEVDEEPPPAVTESKVVGEVLGVTEDAEGVEVHLRIDDPGLLAQIECCASGRCEVCTPGYDRGRDG